jgi:hypothetical protein
VDVVENKMNPWWLLLIVPGSFFLGFSLACLLVIASKGDQDDQLANIKAQEFESGFKEGLNQLRNFG